MVLFLLPISPSLAASPHSELEPHSASASNPRLNAVYYLSLFSVPTPTHILVHTDTDIAVYVQYYYLPLSHSLSRSLGLFRPHCLYLSSKYERGISM